MRIAAAAAFAGILFSGAAAPVEAGHTLSHYPSYYPDEIVVDTLDPEVAAKGLAEQTLHAYVGDAPEFHGSVPAHVKQITSLRSFMVLGFDPAVAEFAVPERRCAAARSVIAALGAASGPDFVFHPYPVTPYHPDYVHHADRAEAALSAAGNGAAPAPAKIDARGALARKLAGSRLASPSSVTLEEVAADGLSPAFAAQLDGWLGPPWVKTGWFQAYRLLAPALDAAPKLTADEIYQRLTHGEVSGLAEEAELERRLVAILTDECRRVVIGYAVRREFINQESSAGIENVAYDSLAGLNAPVFVRTAKLKDFPWNGSLRLGVGEAPGAAWNPVAGFTDRAGRLVWSALGDPAMFPIPYNAGWAPNRVQFEVAAAHGQSGGVRMPADALMPEAGTGALGSVPARSFAAVKVAYDVVGSPYLDGSAIDMADVLYPYAFAWRWGAAEAPGGRPREPAIAAAFGAMRERLAGLRPAGVKRTVQNIAEGLDIQQRNPAIEVYLRDAPGGDEQIAALAPPWSAVPWHLLALMEAAVERGYAAFSRDEAARRGVPWLDLARDPGLREKLAVLCSEFERARFRPASLERFVTAGEAAQRWRALRLFAVENGHFLVTNGPYRLKSWSAGRATLTAVREATYPLGFGTFDHMANPPRAAIRKVTRAAGAIMVEADADLTVNVMRRYDVRREPLTRGTAKGTRGVLVASRYLLIGPDGAVAAAGKMDWESDNRFRIPLPGNLPAGRYAAVFGVFLDGNARQAAVEVFRFEAGGGN